MHTERIASDEIRFERIEFEDTIGPKFDGMDAASFYAYVNSLRNEDFKKTYRPKKPFREVDISRNKKGSFVVRIKREPKIILKSEISAAAKELGESEITVWNLIKKRKINIVEKLPEINIC